MPPTADGTDALAVMLSAKIPLQRGRLRARLDQARLRAAQVEARQEAIETAITTEIADVAYAARREAETLVLFRDRLLPQAQATVESVLAAYTTGEADYVAFLDAERSRFQVQLGLEESLGRYLDATARLERALGGTALLDLAEGTTNAPALPEDPRLR
jgi:outer membrane protein TolC